MKSSFRGHDNETAAWVAKSNDGTELGIVVILGVARPQKARYAAVDSVLKLRAPAVFAVTASLMPGKNGDSGPIRTKV